MSDLERAARALCRENGSDPCALIHTKLDRRMWQAYVSDVRAVLTALREPSDEMLDKADLENCWDEPSKSCFAAAWRNMIDHILEGR